jgi:transcriptional regulator with XRE-family HTH domain
MVKKAARAARKRPRPLHERLQHLFDTVRNPTTDRPYTLREIAERVRELGVDVSHAYLNYLVRGERTNPSLDLVQALSKIFGVSPMYFFDDELAQRVDEQLTTLYAMRDLQTAMEDPDVPVLAVRARGLSRESLAQLLELASRFRQLEGLDHPDAKRPAR